MQQIVVIGCGPAGLVAAKKLTDKGYYVRLFEKSPRTALGYPWYDTVEKDLFESLGIPPMSEGVAPKQRLTSVAPDGSGAITQTEKMSKRMDVQRQCLIRHLINWAHNVPMEFNCAVTSIVRNGEEENGSLTLVLADGRRIDADLVIDASGALSPFREAFLGYCGQIIEPQESDLLYAYRGYYVKRKTADYGEVANTYIKNMGLNGVAWCKDVPEGGAMDVLISDSKPLDNQKLSLAFFDLMSKNPCLTADKIFGRRQTLSLRYPLAVPVAQNYAAVGDSAFYATPISGSGIDNAMQTAAILAEEYAKDPDFGGLWKYAVHSMREVGSKNALLDVVKRWLFKEIEPKDINWLFGSGIITDNIYSLATMDFARVSDLGIEELKSAAATAAERKDLIPKIFSMLTAAVAAKVTALAIPIRYSARLVKMWAARYDNAVRREQFD